MPNFCSKCAAELPEQGNYCAHCGTCRIPDAARKRLSRENRCKKCFMPLPPDGDFCPYCGTRQSAEKRRRKKRPNGTGTVYKQAGRRKQPWVAVKDRQYIGFYDTEQQALQALQQANVQYGDNLPDYYNWTLEDYYNAFAARELEHYGDGGNGIRAAWRYLDFCKAEPMRDIRTYHFQRAIDDATAAGKSKSTCEKIRVLGNHLCKMAMRDDLHDKNYASLVKLPKSPKAERSILTLQELRIIKQHDDDRDARIILTMAFSGTRINELFGLRRENVHLEEGYMTGGEKTAAGRDRFIPIHPLIQPYIVDFYAESAGCEYLIVNQNGKMMSDDNWRKRKFYPLLERFGILAPVKKGERHRITPHCCRHTYAAMMVSNKTDPELLKYIMGHEDYETTINIYDHITDVDKANMIKAVNNLQVDLL